MQTSEPQPYSSPPMHHPLEIQPINIQPTETYPMNQPPAYQMPMQTPYAQPSYSPEVPDYIATPPQSYMGGQVVDDFYNHMAPGFDEPEQSVQIKKSGFLDQVTLEVHPDNSPIQQAQPQPLPAIMQPDYQPDMYSMPQIDSFSSHLDPLPALESVPAQPLPSATHYMDLDYTPKLPSAEQPASFGDEDWNFSLEIPGDVTSALPASEDYFPQENWTQIETPSYPDSQASTGYLHDLNIPDPYPQDIQTVYESPYTTPVEYPEITSAHLNEGLPVIPLTPAYPHDPSSLYPSQPAPPENFRLEDLNIQDVYTLDDSKNLLYVQLKGTFALMGMVGQQISSVKVFSHNILPSGKMNVSELKPRELFQVQLGPWQGIVNLSNESFMLLTEFGDS